MFTSCSVTKRRYTGGYSVSWRQAPPKVLVEKESVIIKSSISHKNIEKLSLKDVSVATESTSDKRVLFHHVNKATPLFSHKNAIYRNISVNGDGDPVVNSNKNKGDEAPSYVRDNYFRKVCSQSKTSLSTGIFSLTVTLFSLTLGLSLIALKASSVGFWATSDLAGPVMVIGSFSGGVLGIIAMVFGIIALHKINAAEEKYTGKDNAITGIVFASILFVILTFLLA